MLCRRITMRRRGGKQQIVQSGVVGAHIRKLCFSLCGALLRSGPTLFDTAGTPGDPVSPCNPALCGPVTLISAIPEQGS